MKLEVSIEDLRGMGLDDGAAKEIADKVRAVGADTPAPEAWRLVSRRILSPDLPFAVHLHLYKRIFAEWDGANGPPPAWTPTEDEVNSSNIAALSRRAGIRSVLDLHRWSAEHREEFWKEIIRTLEIRFQTDPSGIVDLSGGIEQPRWLPGARLNIAESCFQAGRQTRAIVYQREGGPLEELTVGELDSLTNRFANALRSLSLPRDASVAIAMPMTVEAVVAYLGTVKAGYAVASIADSFAPAEIATRLRISGARTAVTQDVVLRGGKTLPMYQKVVEAGVERAIVVPATPGGFQVTLRKNDASWDGFLAPSDRFSAVACDPDDTTNYLFSSGTTGDPKAIPWTHTTPIKCAMDGYLHHDIKPGEVVAWPTSIGWMMGPWLIYASLINRATVALYYGAPVSREFCEFVQNARVRMLGVVPSLVKAWQNSGAARDLDWSSIKLFSSTGECSNSDDYLYLMSLARYRPIIEYCGGTEIGGGYISGTIVQPASPATFSTPSYGLDFCILDERGQPTRNGELFIIPPSIGLSNTLLNKDHHEVYYADTPRGPKGELLRRHGDETEELPGGYYRGHGRADDTMNLGGIKVSSTEIERALASVEGVVETAAIAFNPPQGGPSLLVVYAVISPGATANDALKKDMQRAIAARLNPLFKIHDVVPVAALPRTASNKVMRRVLRDTYAKSR
jgi:acetyl-CoA synthetase